MKYIFTLTLAFLANNMLAQNVGIGTASPNPSAVLDLSSPSKGLLLPRNADPAGTVSTPAAGLLLYNSTTNQPNYYNGSQWQPLGYLGQQFQQSIAYAGTSYTIAPSTTDYIWPVPAGVTSVWIEMWSGGDAGSTLAATADDFNSLGAAGGDAGDYLSILLPVTVGNNISISVGKGGTSSFVAAGNTSIVYGIHRFSIAQASLGFTYQASNITTIPAPYVLSFVGGQQGLSSVQSFQQSSSTVFRRVVVSGKGGDAFMGGAGGSGRTISYNMADGAVFPTGLTSANGTSGSAPGGGGGAGYGTPGGGGPGMVIIHY